MPVFQLRLAIANTTGTLDQSFEKLDRSIPFGGSSQHFETFLAIPPAFLELWLAVDAQDSFLDLGGTGAKLDIWSYSNTE